MQNGMGGPGGFMPPKHAIAEKNKEPLPKNIKEVPRFVKNITVTFFSRLFYIFKLVWETNPWILIFMVALSLIQGVLPVIGTYISAQILNKLSLTLTGAEITVAVIGVLFVYQFIYLFVNRITADVNRIVTSLSGEMVTNHIRRKIMSKAKDVDIANFDLPDFYEKLENANREAGMRPIQILNSTLNILSTAITLISFIVFFVGISTWAPILVALLALPSAMVSFIYRSKTAGYMRLRSKSRRQMNYYSSVMVNKDIAKEIRLLDLGDDFEKRYDEVFKDYFKGLKKLILHEGFWNIGFGFLRIIASCVLFFLIAMLVMDKKIQVGDYSLYTNALNHITSSVTTLINSIATIYEGTLFIDNLISFMKHEKKIVPLGKGIFPKTDIGHKIEFKNVGFKYPGTEKMVLKNLSFVLEPGQTAALIGLNGAGKTTIIKLLTRVYDVTEGNIYLDDKDIREYDVKALYGLFGIVFQDFGHYAVTVKENIEFGAIHKPESLEDVIVAAKQANAYDYISSLPRKFDTPLMRFFEDDGLELSGGQWQKVAVARAFYGDSDILILDEPTASLDALAEQEIFNQFDSLRKGKTTVFVSHRLSSAVCADKILVVKEGHVIEEGNHAYLMSLGGEYAKMFNVQAERYVKKY